jgi:glucose/arabinose dehydrogenase
LRFEFALLLSVVVFGLVCSGCVVSTPEAAPTQVTNTPLAAGETAQPASPLPDITEVSPPLASATAAPPITPTPEPAVPAVGLESIRLELVLTTEGLERPVSYAHAGDSSGRHFVVEKVGRIRIFQEGGLVGVPFLDITDRVGSAGNEQGLLGLVFHPDYEVNGQFYVNYTDLNGNTVIARFTVTDNPDLAAPGSEKVILTQEQPAANHNGGQLAFGPDGYLYIGLGDGGGADDRFGNGQNGQTFLGKILRVDVDGGDPYAIPPDNPFVSDASLLDEIWATGLRNPWRFSFDRATGDMYIADVGQDQYEEIDFAPAGEGGQNYGWPIMEGINCFQAATCYRMGYVHPVTQYGHELGCAVIGGHVYRGTQHPAMEGVYLFGDNCSGFIWGLRRDASGAWQVAELAATELRLSSFGEDENGELYALDDRGALYQITVPVN